MDSQCPADVHLSLDRCLPLCGHHRRRVKAAEEVGGDRVRSEEGWGWMDVGWKAGWNNCRVDDGNRILFLSACEIGGESERTKKD